jgi:hypothetical protein
VASVFSSPWPSPTPICVYDYILTRFFSWICFFRCGKQQWCIISHDYRGPLESDIGYTIEVKYFAFRIVEHSCVFSQFFHVAQRRWLQGKSHATRTSSCIQHSHLWWNVRNSCSSSTGLLISTCPCLILCQISAFLYSFSVFLQDGHILVIDPVTAILNLMTAFGLLAVASLVRNLPSAQTLSLLPPFRSCLFLWRAFVPCCKLPYGSVESSESSFILLNHI